MRFRDLRSPRLPPRLKMEVKLTRLGRFGSQGDGSLSSTAVEGGTGRRSTSWNGRVAMERRDERSAKIVGTECSMRRDDEIGLFRSRVCLKSLEYLRQMSSPMLTCDDWAFVDDATTLLQSADVHPRASWKACSSRESTMCEHEDLGIVFRWSETSDRMQPASALRWLLGWRMRWTRIHRQHQAAVRSPAFLVVQLAWSVRLLADGWSEAGLGCRFPTPSSRDGKLVLGLCLMSRVDNCDKLVVLILPRRKAARRAALLSHVFKLPWTNGIVAQAWAAALLPATARPRQSCHQIDAASRLHTLICLCLRW